MAFYSWTLTAAQDLVVQKCSWHPEDLNQLNEIKARSLENAVAREKIRLF